MAPIDRRDVGERDDLERRPLVTPARPNRREAMAALAGLLAGVPRSAAASDSALRLRRGVSFHHMLNWPRVAGAGETFRYLWPPFATPEYRTAAEELRRLRQVGFDFVRLTADPSIFIAAPAQLRPELIKRAEDAVTQLLSAGLNVVFDLHAVAVNPAYAPEALVAADAGAPFAAYVEMVGRVAEALKPFPRDRLAFELFNEPWIDDLAQAPRWQAMLTMLYRRARVVDPDRALVLNGLQWDSARGLAALDARPFAGEPALYTFHYYEPRAFTQQGAVPDARYISGLGWPTRPDEADAALERATAQIASDPSLTAAARQQALNETRGGLAWLREAPHDERRIAEDFAAVARWARREGVSADRVVLGEFGCVAGPAGAPLGESRLRWLATVRRAAEAQGFGWALWLYRGPGGMQLVRGAGRAMDGETLVALGLSAS